MPPKRKSASEVPVQEISSPKKPKQEIDNVFDVPTEDIPVNISHVEPAMKKAATPRKPRAKKQASLKEPAVAESPLPYLEGEPSSGTQIPIDAPQEPPPPVKKTRKPRAKKQDPLSIENLLIHTDQEPKISQSAPVNSSAPEKKPRKPRAKKKDAHSDPLAINNLLIQEPETAQIIPQFINVTDTVPVSKPRKSKAISQPPHDEDNLTVGSGATTANQQEIEPQEIAVIPQGQPVKKPRKPRAKKQELPLEHPIADEVVSSNQQSIMIDDHVINSAQQVFDVQMKPKTTTRTPRTRKKKVPEDVQPELGDASSTLDNKDATSEHVDESAQKASSTKRGRPRKEKTTEVSSHDDTNASSSLANEADEHAQKTKRGRPRKEKVSESVPIINESEASSTGMIKGNDGASGHAEEHLQKTPTSRRGRPRKEKQVETSSHDEHLEDSQMLAEEENASSKKRRGRKPKKDDSEANTLSQGESLTASKSRGVTKKRNKKLDGLQVQQHEESIDHIEISKNSFAVGVERADTPSSLHKTEYDSHKELSEIHLSSDDRLNEVNRNVIQDSSYLIEKETIKEDFQNYYGNSLDVLASVSVGDTIIQGVNVDRHNIDNINKNVTEEKDENVIDVPYSTSSQLQRSADMEGVTRRNLQITEDAQNKKTVEQDVTMREVGEDLATSGDDSERESPKRLTPAEKMKGRFEHLQKLRSRMDEAEQANRQELYDEHQRKKINPREKIRQERRREEAEKLLSRQEAEEKGEDYERKQFWNYSVESVEKWEKKQEKKLKRSDIAFTDYNQVAHKKYKRMINDFVPDLASYNSKKETARASASLVTTEDGEVVPIDAESKFYRDANSLQYASVDDQPSREAIDRLVIDVEKQIERRDKFSRQKTVNEDDDITYINERNRKFNEKIGRFYDKYTQEIKENFERGTAL